MVKQRRNGRVVGTKLRVIYGDKPETLELLGISTVHAEHNHHTMRLPNGRLVRKASAVWEHLVYNLARPQRRYAWR
jgi:hypothetical protein